MRGLLLFTHTWENASTTECMHDTGLWSASSYEGWQMVWNGGSSRGDKGTHEGRWRPNSGPCLLREWHIIIDKRMCGGAKEQSEDAG